VDIGLYSNRIDNYIYLQPDSVPIVRQRGAFPAYSYNQVRAIFRGADVTVRYSVSTRLTFTSRTSLLVAYDRTNGAYLVYIPPIIPTMDCATHSAAGSRWARSDFRGGMSA